MICAWRAPTASRAATRFGRSGTVVVRHNVATPAPTSSPSGPHDVSSRCARRAAEPQSRRAECPSPRRLARRSLGSRKDAKSPRASPSCGPLPPKGPQGPATSPLPAFAPWRLCARQTPPPTPPLLSTSRPDPTRPDPTRTLIPPPLCAPASFTPNFFLPPLLHPITPYAKLLMCGSPHPAPSSPGRSLNTKNTRAPQRANARGPERTPMSNHRAQSPGLCAGPLPHNRPPPPAEPPRWPPRLGSTA